MQLSKDVITAKGACEALCWVWLDGYINGVDFWGDVFTKTKSKQLIQRERKNVIATTGRLEHAEQQFERGSAERARVTKEMGLTCFCDRLRWNMNMGTGQTLGDQLINQLALKKGYYLVGLSEGVGGVGHAVCVVVEEVAWRLFDPNFGEARFTLANFGFRTMTHAVKELLDKKSPYTHYKLSGYEILG